MARTPFKTATLLIILASLSAEGGRANFAVKYRSATNVYLDGGRAEGLRQGDRLQLSFGGEITSELEVVFVSDHSASCRLLSEKRPIRAGDLFVLVTTRSEAAPPSPAPGTASPPASSGTAERPTTGPSVRTPRKIDRPWARARGAVSFGYFRMFDQSPTTNMDYAEKTFRGDLTLADIGGAPYTFTARLRSRHDGRLQRPTLVNPQSAYDNRLYELSLRYEPEADNFAFEAGRIGVSRYVGLGYLDGAVGRVRLGSSPAQIGGFFGMSTDRDGLGLFDGTGQKYGGFVRLSPPGRYSGSYESVVGIVRELNLGQMQREYLTVESRLAKGSRLLFFERAELDLRRGTPSPLTPTTYQMSNVSVSANVRFAGASYALFSYDARKLPQLVLTPTDPLLMPLDSLQQGLRANVTVGPAGGVSVSGGVTLRLQDTAAQQNAISFNGGFYHPHFLGLTLGADASQFSNGITSGILIMGRAGKRFRAGHSIEVTYGNSMYRLVSTGENRNTNWLRFSVNGELGRGIYLLGDSELYRGDDLQGPKGLFEVGYRF